MDRRARWPARLRAKAARLRGEDPSCLPDLSVPLHRLDPVLRALGDAPQAMRKYQPDGDRP